jgi:LL-diaminopimelate aminotransferase
MFYPLQLASITALNGPDEFMAERNQILKERRDVVVAGLRGIGLELESPKATFYVWASVPNGYKSRDFCFDVLEDIGVWMMPGSMYGERGEGYVRIALTHPAARLAEAMDRLKKWTVQACPGKVAP